MNQTKLTRNRSWLFTPATRPDRFDQAAPRKQEHPMSDQRPSQEVRHSVIGDASDPDPILTRRAALFSTFLAGLPFAFSGKRAEASPIDTKETLVVLPKEIKWTAWSGLPAHSAEMATLSGGLDREGPYVVLMKWYPGYMSAPHWYVTDRLCVVVSGTWWVNSGKDFDPGQCVPVPAGGFVRRVARTPHYDGVMKDATEPAVIAIFGMAPVDLKLVDPAKPGWRQL
jgi:hypothetical protein